MTETALHPNEALVRRLYAAFGGRDLAALAELLARDVAWHVPGRSALAGEYRGLEAILGYFARLHARSGGTFRATTRHLVGTADGAIAHADTHAERAGRTLALSYVMVFGVADGRIREARLYSEDLYAFDAFWGAEAMPETP